MSYTLDENGNLIEKKEAYSLDAQGNLVGGDQEPGHGIYRKIEDMTGLPADVSSSFAAGALPWLDTVPAPEDAGFIRKQVPGLLGMGVGFKGIGAATKGLGLAAKTLPGILTKAGVDFGIYGAAEKADGLGDRAANAGKSALMGVGLAGTGMVALKAAAGKSELIKSALKTLESGGTLQGKEKLAMAAFEHANAGAIGAGFGAKEAYDQGVSDPADFMKVVGAGAGAMTLTHSITSMMPSLKSTKDKLLKATQDPVIQNAADVQDKEVTAAVGQQGESVVDKGHDAVVSSHVEAVKQHQEATVQTMTAMQQATQEYNALSAKKAELARAGAPKEEKKIVDEALVVAADKIKQLKIDLETTAKAVPVPPARPVKNTRSNPPQKPAPVDPLANTANPAGPQLDAVLGGPHDPIDQNIQNDPEALKKLFGEGGTSVPFPEGVFNTENQAGRDNNPNWPLKPPAGQYDPLAEKSPTTPRQQTPEERNYIIHKHFAEGTRPFENGPMTGKPEEPAPYDQMLNDSIANSWHALSAEDRYSQDRLESLDKFKRAAQTNGLPIEDKNIFQEMSNGRMEELLTVLADHLGIHEPVVGDGFSVENADGSGLSKRVGPVNSDGVPYTLEEVKGILRDAANGGGTLPMFEKDEKWNVIKTAMDLLDHLRYARRTQSLRAITGVQLDAAKTQSQVYKFDKSAPRDAERDNYKRDQDQYVAGKSAEELTKLQAELTQKRVSAKVIQDELRKLREELDFIYRAEYDQKFGIDKQVNDNFESLLSEVEKSDALYSEKVSWSRDNEGNLRPDREASDPTWPDPGRLDMGDKTANPAIDIPGFDRGQDAHNPEAKAEPRESLNKEFMTQQERNDQKIMGMLDDPGLRLEYGSNPKAFFLKHPEYLLDENGKQFVQFKTIGAQKAYVDKLEAQRVAKLIGKKINTLGTVGKDGVLLPTGEAPSRKIPGKTGVRSEPTADNLDAGESTKLNAKEEMMLRAKERGHPDRQPVLMPVSAKTGERVKGHPEWRNEPAPDMGRGTVQPGAEYTTPSSERPREAMTYGSVQTPLERMYKETLSPEANYKTLGPSERNQIEGDAFNAEHHDPYQPGFFNEESLAGKIDRDTNNATPANQIIPEDATPDVHEWIAAWAPTWNLGKNAKLDLGQEAVIRAAEEKTGLNIRLIGQATDSEVASTLVALVANPNRDLGAKVVIFGHGEGKGIERRFVGGEKWTDVARRMGEDAYVISCEDLQKRNFSTAEGMLIKFLEKAGLPTEPPKPTALTQEQTRVEAQHDASFLAFFAGIFRLSDKYPVLTKKVRAMLEHSNEYVHNFNTKVNEVRNIINIFDKAAGKNDVERSLLAKVFGPEGTKSQEVRDNWEGWVDGSKAVPAKFQKGVDAFRNFNISYHVQIVAEKRMQRFAEVKRLSYVRDKDGYKKDGNGNYLLNDGKECRPLLYEQDTKLLHLAEEAEKGIIDLREAKKNPSLLAASLERYNKKTKAEKGASEKFGEQYTIEDIFRAEGINRDLDNLAKFGKDPKFYVHQVFTGQYKVMSGEGHAGGKGQIIGSGTTARAARENAYFNLVHDAELRKKYSLQGDFTMTTTLHQMMDARGAYVPDVKYHEEGSVGAINQAFATWNWADVFDAIRKATGDIEKEMLSEATSEAKDRLQMNIQPDMSHSHEKWAAALLKRTTSLKGEQADPFQALVHYAMAIEKKWSVDKAMVKIRQDLKDNPFLASDKNLQQVFEMKLRDFQGKYSFEDRELDNVRLRMADFVDSLKVGKLSGLSDALRSEGFGMTRFANTYMGLTSNLTMGYAPVKAAMNRYGGVMHIIIQTSAADYKAGLAWKNTPEGKAILEGNRHRYGGETTFANPEGKVIEKRYMPLYMHQKMELMNRDDAFATGYVKAVKEGMSTVTDQKTGTSPAEDFARNVVEITQGIYAAVARPALVSGPIAKMTFQFKQYMVNEQRFLAQLTPQQWAKYVPYILAAGGSRGGIIMGKSLLAMAGAGALLDKIDQYMNLNHPEIHRGIPGLVNMDLSAAATWQFPISMREWVGKPLSDLGALKDAFMKGLGTNMTDKEKSDLYRQVLPTMYSVHKGLEILTTGEITKGSHVQSRVPMSERYGAAAVNFMGARTVNESRNSDAIQMLATDSKQSRDRFVVLTDKWANEDNPMKKGAYIQQMIREGVAPRNLAVALRHAMKTRNMPVLMNALRTATAADKQKIIQHFITQE